jgi:hypothetical protein
MVKYITDESEYMRIYDLCNSRRLPRNAGSYSTIIPEHLNPHLGVYKGERFREERGCRVGGGENLWPLCEELLFANTLP